MDTLDAHASDPDSFPPDPEPVLPTLEVELSTVSVVDGIWQDQPDNVAAFVEARLGELARGRGNLYICLDVSGDVEGRADLERALIEVIRDTYASSRGSISFGLSEALRAANAHLYENNRQVSREARRMAGVSAVILRASDLYIAQAGPAVVYVEASEKLARFPGESDWFVEDAPMIAPQGAASAPLGIRREFVSDLAHVSVSAGDVFVLATRALTQLATTDDLAIAFTERSAPEIGSYLEELGEDADLTALVCELANPLAAHATEEASFAGRQPPQEHIESLPVPLDALVSLDAAEPPVVGQLDESDLDDEGEWEPVPAPSGQEAAHLSPAPDENFESELDWEDDELDGADLQATEQQVASPPGPVYTAAAAAALPILNPSAFTAPARPERETPAAPPRRDLPPEPSRAEWEAELERRRAERAARRAAQKEGVSRAVGGTTGAVVALAGGVGGAVKGLFGVVDWDAAGKSTNRFLNLGVGALISFFLLLVRLVLPGAAPRSTSLIPRRATSDAVWLKPLGLLLPLVFLALAGGAFLNRQSTLNAQYDDLIVKADTIVKQAEVNPDKTEARVQLNAALKQIREAQAIQDSVKARGVLYRIQDRLNELDGVAVLYFLPTVAQVGGGQLQQIAASDQDVFLLDGRGRIYKYVVNDASGAVESAPDNGVILQVGSKVGNQAIDALKLLTVATPAQDKATLVAVAQNALLVYDLEGNQWTASPVQDASNWGDLRAISSFGGNIYVLDAKNNQIYRYSPTATGYSDKAVNYFPANSQPVLARAVDLAIDGDVWVLNDNGSVQRFRAGAPIPFQLGALTPPLKNPVAIFTRPEADSLYVADAGNQRIVEFDKNGAFVRQFKPYSEKGDVFKNLRDFTVNETKRKLYFVSSDAAYMANVPK